MWLEIGDDLFNTDTICVVRPSSDKGKTIIFIVGQSAVDGGFLVDMPFNEVGDKLRQARIEELTEYMNAADSTLEPEPSHPLQDRPPVPSDIEPELEPARNPLSAYVEWKY